MRKVRAILLMALLASMGALPSGYCAVSELTVPSGPGAGEPFLAATRDGLLLSWLEPVPRTSDNALRVALYREGKWSEAHTVVQRSDLFVNWADFPSVVEDARGTLFAHWLQRSGNSAYAYDVRIAASKDAGYTWTASMLLNRDGRKSEHGFVSLAPLPHGGVAAAWLDGRNMVEGKEEGDMTVRYATIDAAGTIRSDVQLDDRACECCTTGMTVVGARPVIVYRDRSATEVRDIAVVRQTAKGWSKPHLIHADHWKIAACPVNGPRAGARGDQLAVAWFTGAVGSRAYVAFSGDSGATFDKPVVIDDGKPVGRVDVVMLDRQSAAVIWLEQTGGGAEVRARRVGRNGTISTSVKVADSTTARAAGFPRAALVGQSLYVAWTEQSGLGKHIKVARVDL